MAYVAKYCVPHAYLSFHVPRHALQPVKPYHTEYENHTHYTLDHHVISLHTDLKIVLIDSLRFAGLFEYNTRQLCERLGLGNVTTGSWQPAAGWSCCLFLLSSCITP
ncbi:unnamed protein product [Ectocarpus sp. 8 AP-2014]